MKKAICFTAIIAAAIAGQAQARPAPVFTDAELAAFLQGAPLKKTGLEGLRARDLDVIERLRAALLKRYGAFIGDAEMFISRGIEASRVFYRIDFSGLASPDHARALCMAMRLDQCGIIDEASGTVVLEPVLKSLAGRPARTQISALKAPDATRLAGASPRPLDPPYGHGAVVAPKNPCAGDAAFFACNLPDWARQGAGKEDAAKTAAKKADGAADGVADLKGSAAGAPAGMTNPGWIEPVTPAAAATPTARPDRATIVSDPVVSGLAAPEPAVSAPPTPGAILPEAPPPGLINGDRMVADAPHVDPVTGISTPNASGVSGDAMGEAMGARPVRDAVGEAPVIQPLPDDASLWAGPFPSETDASAGDSQDDGALLAEPQVVEPQVVEPDFMDEVPDSGVFEDPAMDVEGRFMGIRGAPDDVLEAGGFTGGVFESGDRDFVEVAMTMVSDTIVTVEGSDISGVEASGGAAGLAANEMVARRRPARGTAPSFLVGLRPYPDDATDYFTPRPLTLAARLDTRVVLVPGGAEPDDASDLLLAAERATSSGEEKIASAAASLRAMFASPDADALSVGVAFDGARLARASTGIRIAPPESPEPTETSFSVVSIDDRWVESVADPFGALPPQALKTPRLRPEARMAAARIAQRMTPEMISRIAAARSGSEGFRLAVMMPDTTAKRIMMAAAPAGIDERRRLAALLPANLADAVRSGQSGVATTAEGAGFAAGAGWPRTAEVAQALPARPGLRPAPQDAPGASSGADTTADAVRRDALDVINRAADPAPSLSTARPGATVVAPAAVAVAPTAPVAPTVTPPPAPDFADMARRLNGASSVPAPFSNAPRPERVVAPEIYAPNDDASASQGTAERTAERSGNARLGLGMGLPDQPARTAEPIVYDALGESYDWVGRGEGSAPLAAPAPAYGARQAQTGQMQPGQMQPRQSPPPTTIVTDQYGRPMAPAASPLAGLMGDQIPMESRIGGIVERSVAPPAPQISIADLRLELSYLSRREDIAQRVAQIRAFLPPVMLEKGRFYAMEAPGAPGIYVVGLQANGLTERDDLVWYFGQVGLKYAFRR